MKTLVLINEKSGAVSAVGAERCVSAIRETDLEADMEVHIAAGNPASLIHEAKKAVASGDTEKILALGGDGTAAALAGVLADADIALAPLPGGTMNAYARDLGFDPDLFTAIKQLASAQKKRVDIGIAGSYAFLNNLVFGAYSVVAQSREHLREADTIGEKAEAVTEIVGVIAHSGTEAYTITADGASKVINTNTVMVSNNFYDDIGIMLPKRTTLNSGMLGLYTAASTTPVDFLSIIFEALTQALDESELLSLTQCRQCRISVASGILDVTIDGEAMELPSPLDIKINHKGLTVLAPAVLAPA